jgi:hypothetical protein
MFIMTVVLCSSLNMNSCTETTVRQYESQEACFHDAYYKTRSDDVKKLFKMKGFQEVNCSTETQSK